MSLAGGPGRPGGERPLRLVLMLGIGGAILAWGAVSLVVEPAWMVLAGALAVGVVPVACLRGALSNERRERGRRDVKRVFWSVSADFEPDGWAKRDLTELAFLCGNVASDRPVGPRLEARIARSVDAVRFGVVDRLYDLVSIASIVELDRGVIDRLDRATAQLAKELSSGKSHLGPVAPSRVALAAREAEAAARTLRRLYCEGLESDAGALIAWLIRSRRERQVSQRHASLEIRGGAISARVRVPSIELTTSLDRLLSSIEELSAPGSSIALKLEPDGERVDLTISWSPCGGAYSPAGMVLETLMGYGARFSIDETSGFGGELSRRLVLSLPRDARLSGGGLPLRVRSSAQEVSEVLEGSSYFMRAGSGASDRVDVTHGTSTDL